MSVRIHNSYGPQQFLTDIIDELGIKRDQVLSTDEQWSKFVKIVDYVDVDKNDKVFPVNFHTPDIKGF